MAPCCVRTHSIVKEFTILLIHVVHVSHPAVLNESTGYACEIVNGFFFLKYTHIDCSHFEPHIYKFRHLNVDSQLQIAFTGRSKRYKVLTIIFIIMSIPKGPQ